MASASVGRREHPPRFARAGLQPGYRAGRSRWQTPRPPSGRVRSLRSPRGLPSAPCTGAAPRRSRVGRLRLGPGGTGGPRLAAETGGDRGGLVEGVSLRIALGASWLGNCPIEESCPKSDPPRCPRIDDLDSPRPARPGLRPPIARSARVLSTGGSQACRKRQLVPLGRPTLVTTTDPNKSPSDGGRVLNAASTSTATAAPCPAPSHTTQPSRRTGGPAWPTRMWSRLPDP
jgi:hypothetical protein